MKRVATGKAALALREESGGRFVTCCYLTLTLALTPVAYPGTASATTWYTPAFVAFNAAVEFFVKVALATLSQLLPDWICSTTRLPARLGATAT